MHAWKAPLLAFALLAVAAMSGCQGPDRDRDPPPPPPGTPSAFDGAAALGFVEGLVTGDDGSTRYRIPGTPGQAEGALWLWQAMEAPGWTRSWDNFSYATYREMPAGEAEYYSTRCPPSDSERVREVGFHNLVAIRPATANLSIVRPLVLLGAHWDSKAEASSDPDPAKRAQPIAGANDGASGVGVLLQLMREVEQNAQRGVVLPYDLGIVLFDGEDGFEDCHPLAGSIHYANTQPNGSPALLILLDMVGDPEARFPRESHGVESAPHVVEALWSRAHLHGLGENFVNATRSVVDDHVPFTEAGVPAVDIIDLARPTTSFPPYWHTTGDTLDKLDADMMGRIGELLLDVLDEPGLA